MRKLSERPTSFENLLLAVIADRLGLLIWCQTKDGHEGRNKPESIYEKLIKPAPSKATRHFSSIEEFKELYYGGDSGK